MPSSTPALTEAFSTPVLLLIFRRPDLTRRVLEVLRQVRPTRLYVAADGPRPGHLTDERQCTEARQVLKEVDWPCQVVTLFQEQNLNCGLGPVTALNWFFAHEEEGIILEDDCVPSASFFPFCAELLARYRHEEQVMHIGGNNFGSEARRPLAPDAPSYHFSTQRTSWGWATWRRAWQRYEYHMPDFHAVAASGGLDAAFSGRLEKRYRLAKMAGVLALPQPPDVWDYQWEYAIARHQGLYIIPAVNLVGNLGFGGDSTHTHDAQDTLGMLPAQELPFPLRHPVHVVADRRRDNRRFNDFLLGRCAAVLRRLVSGVFPLARGLQSPRCHSGQAGLAPATTTLAPSK